MRILHVASEIFPLVKTGGLADVVAALPPALIKQGVDARVLLPGLPGILDGIEALKPVIRIGPAFSAAVIDLKLGRLPGSDVQAYVIDAPFLYRRPGNPYTGPDGQDWRDNHRRFALLGWMAAHLGAGELDPAWVPDVVHAHDWHAGLAPVYMAQNPALPARSVFTVHNLAFRGIFPLELHPEMHLPLRKITPTGAEFHGKISFMKAGLVYADRVTTVSPTYAKEICTPEFGWGLEGVLRERSQVLSGILNGVDYDVWSPTGAQVVTPYSAQDMSGKAECRRALREELGLAPDATGPLFAVVSRLTSQKGMDLLLAALPELLREGGQLAVLGSGDGDLEAGFRYAATVNPGNVAVHIGYDEALSHRFMSGADVLLVPSRFEPCGLTQLYALRFGTLPLVRRVGGLADTVVDASEDNLRSGRATGFVFGDASRHALAESVRAACALFRDGERWQSVQLRGMAQDFSWEDSAAHYIRLYRNLLGE